MKTPDYIDQLHGMRMARRAGHTSPHKVVMILAVPRRVVESLDELSVAEEACLF